MRFFKFDIEYLRENPLDGEPSVCKAEGLVIGNSFKEAYEGLELDYGREIDHINLSIIDVSGEYSLDFKDVYVKKILKEYFRPIER